MINDIENRFGISYCNTKISDMNLHNGGKTAVLNYDTEHKANSRNRD